MSGDIKINGDVVANVIRAAMDKLGLRNQDLVDICGTRARASEIVNGVRAVPKSMVIPLAKRLRVPVAKLIG